MEPLLYFSLVLLLGITAQWLAWRLRLPSILLLLIAGFGLGNISGVKIDSFLQSDSVLLSLVGLCVAIILFEGGLTLKFSDLKESGTPILRLCTIGVACSFLLTFACCFYLLNLDWQIAALLSSILVVTGPTVISPLLRHINPSRKIANVVKWEGIVIDPLGAILAVLVYQVILAGTLHTASLALLVALGKTILIGGVFAFLLGKGIEILLKKHLIPDFLHAPFLLCITAVSFALSNMLQPESGLLTATVLGMTLANQKSVSVKHILEFKENLRVLIISTLFIILSGRISLIAIKEALPLGLALLACLIFFVRPLSIFFSNLFSKEVTIKEQLFLSMMAPRGIVAAAVTAVFALELHHAAAIGKLSHSIEVASSQMVPIVFIGIIGTVTFYGLLAAPLARKLGLAVANPRGILFAGGSLWVRMAAKALHEDGHEVMILDTNFNNISEAKLAGIPAIRMNILSEYAEERLELNGIGQLIAATPNDEVNSLAAQNFASLFGSEHVWQIAPLDDKAHEQNAVASHMRGRIAFPKRPRMTALQTLAARGGVIKKTMLTEQFTLEDFRKTHGKEYILLFWVSENKVLHIARDDMKELRPGSSLYALMLSKDEEPANKKLS